MEKEFKSLLVFFGTALFGVFTYKYVDNRKHEKFMLKLPPEYFTAEAEKARIKADYDARRYEADSAESIAKHKAKLDFEKTAGPEYWAYKSAQEERITREKISKNEADAKIAQAAEMRRAFQKFTEE